ncbi:MAG: hypothetical protein KHW59_10245, partial [Clostridiales bacterium]|nr:hypothetical protein [Clostridiales bacterium]
MKQTTFADSASEAFFDADIFCSIWRKSMTIEQILADIKSGRRKKVILDTDAYNEIDDQYAI